MKRVMINEINNYINKKIVIKGWVYRIRKLKAITFIILRDRTGYVQCVASNDEFKLNSIKVEAVISIYGMVKESENKYNKFEVEQLNIINNVLAELPIELNKENLDINLDTKLNNRMLSIRHDKVNSIFKIQNIIANSFREYLNNEGFTEISTPKLVKEGAEGGTELFKVEYFEKQAYLAQSPQFYKQMMVGAGFENVREASLILRDRTRLMP